MKLSGVPFLFTISLILFNVCFNGILYSTDNIHFVDDEDYAISKISSSLLMNTFAVIRLDQCLFIVDNEGEATRKCRKIITILNKEGLDFCKFQVFYDNIRQLEQYTGTLRNARGEVIRELGESDIEDYSAISVLYEDNRIRLSELISDIFPFTVEFEYEIYHNGLLNWPNWFPHSYNAAVEQSHFEVIIPQQMKMRYYNHGHNTKPKVINEDGHTSYLWKFENLKKHEYESKGPGRSEQMPHIKTAPVEFEIEGYEGNMSSWKSFGQWYYELSKDTRDLPEEAAAKIVKLTEQINDKFRTPDFAQTILSLICKLTSNLYQGIEFRNRSIFYIFLLQLDYPSY